MNKMDIENSNKNKNHVGLDELEDPFYMEDPYNDDPQPQNTSTKEPEPKPKENPTTVKKDIEKTASPKKPTIDEPERAPTNTSKQQSNVESLQKKKSDNAPGDYPIRASGHSEYLVHFYIKDVPYTDKQKDIKDYLDKIRKGVERFGTIKELSVSEVSPTLVSFAIGMLFDSNAQQAIDKVRLKQLFGIERKGNELYLEPSRAFGLHINEKKNENRKMNDPDNRNKKENSPPQQTRPGSPKNKYGRDDDYRDKERRSPVRAQDKYKEVDRRNREIGRDGDRKQDPKQNSAVKEGRDRSRSGSKNRRRSYDRSPRRDHRDERISPRRDHRNDRDFERKDDRDNKYGNRNAKDDARDNFKKGNRSRTKSKSRSRSPRLQGKSQKRASPPADRADNKRYEKNIGNKNQSKDQKFGRDNESLKIIKSQTLPNSSDPITFKQLQMQQQQQQQQSVGLPQFNPAAANPNLLAQNVAGLPGIPAHQLLQLQQNLPLLYANPLFMQDPANPQTQAQIAAAFNAQLFGMGGVSFNPQDLAQFQQQHQQQQSTAIPIQKSLSVPIQTGAPTQNAPFTDPTASNAMENKQSIGTKMNPPPLQQNPQMQQGFQQQPPPPQNAVQRNVTPQQVKTLNHDTVSFLVGIPSDVNEQKVLAQLQKANFETPLSHEWLKEGNMEYLKLVFPSEQGAGHFLRSDFKISINESTSIPVIALPYLPELSMLDMVGYHQMRVDCSESVDLESLVTGLGLSFNDIVDIIQLSDRRFVLVCTKPIQKMRENMEKKDLRAMLKNGKSAEITVSDIEKPEPVIRKNTNNHIFIKKRSGQLNSSVENKPENPDAMQEEDKEGSETGEGGKLLKITNRRSYNDKGNYNGNRNQNYRTEGGKGGYYQNNNRKNQNNGNYDNRQRNYSRDDRDDNKNPGGNYQRGVRNQYEKKPNRGQNYNNK